MNMANYIMGDNRPIVNTITETEILIKFTANETHLRSSWLVMKE